MVITDETLSQISRELLGDESVNFTFTKILVGDGLYPLDNASGPILNHIYSYNVEEITRTGNNILLTATIDEDAYLTISELALYCQYGDGSTHLFSKIEGLSVKKGSDLAYNLIIRVRLDINVVNTIAFPEIITRDIQYPKLSEFKTVQQVFTYVSENLERMIKTNALGIGSYFNLLSSDVGGAQFLPTRPVTLDQDIHGVMTEKKPVGVGYDKAQVYYRLQNKIESWENEFFATFRYALLQKKFTPIPKVYYTFDPSLVETHGKAVVFDNGEAEIHDSVAPVYVEEEALVGDSESFSVDIPQETFVSPDGDFYVDEPEETMLNASTSYITPSTFSTPFFNRWNTLVSFKTSNDVEREQSVICFAGYCNIQPMTLWVKNGACYLSLGQRESMEFIKNSKSIVCSRDSKIVNIGNDRYCSWTIEGDPIPNLHTLLHGDLQEEDGVISGFTTDSYASLPSPFVFTSQPWSISLSFTTGDSLSGSVLSFGNVKEDGTYGINCYLNPHLTVDLSFDGETNEATLEYEEDLETNKTYTVTITYEDNAYSLFVDGQIEDIVDSEKIIDLKETDSFLFGATTANAYITNPLNGSIDLKNSHIRVNNAPYWSGVFDTLKVFTRQLNPSSSSDLFDSEGVLMHNVSFKATYSHAILSSQYLFDLLPLAKYQVKIKFNGHAYSVSYKNEGAEDFTDALSFVSTEEINNIDNIIFGGTRVGFDGYGYPFFGTLYLSEFNATFENRGSSGEVIQDQTISFLRRTEEDQAILKDFMYIPEHKYSYFTVNNLGYDNSSADLVIFEGVLRGNEDHIDLADPKGFSLCVKANLINREDKVILAKGNVNSENFSFILKEEDQSLIFTYYLEGSSETLSTYLGDKITLTSNPISIIITGSPEASPTLKLYINNELKAEKQLSSKSNLDASTFYLTNKLSNDSDYYDKRIISNILSFSGDLTEKEIYYLNNVLDTNF